MHRDAKQTERLTLLVELGRAERYQDIGELPEAGTGEGVTSVVAGRVALSFLERLPPDDLHHLARAVAVLEDTLVDAGYGIRLGSVTLLQHIVPNEVTDEWKSTVKWIVRNTGSFRYYQHRYDFVEEMLADEGVQYDDNDPCWRRR